MCVRARARVCARQHPESTERTAHADLGLSHYAPWRNEMTATLGQEGHERSRQRLTVPETRKCFETDRDASRGIRSRLKGAPTGPLLNNFRIKRNKNRTPRFK